MHHLLIGMLFSGTTASRAAGWQRKWNSPSRGHCCLCPVTLVVFFFNRFFRRGAIQEWMLLGVYAITHVQAWLASYSKGFTQIIQVFGPDRHLESFVFVCVFPYLLQVGWLSHEHIFSGDSPSLFFLQEAQSFVVMQHPVALPSSLLTRSAANRLR